MLIRRLIAFRPSVPDIISYAYIFLQKEISRILCTLLLNIKARLFGIKVGRKAQCYGAVHLVRAPKSMISIGNNVSIVSSSIRCTAGPIYAPTKIRTLSKTSRILIEDNVGLNGTSITARSKTIIIGQGTMVAPNVVMMDSDFHATWPPENRVVNPAFENDADIVIGENAWIGSSCIILKGIVIGKNSIIAAGSVVAQSIPDNVVAGGIPAKVIRSLP